MLFKLFGYISAESLYDLLEKANEVGNSGNKEYLIAGNYYVRYKNIAIRREGGNSEYGFTISLMKDGESLIIAHSETFSEDGLFVPKGPWIKDISDLFSMIKKDNKRIEKHNYKTEKQQFKAKLEQFKN